MKSLRILIASLGILALTACATSVKNTAPLPIAAQGPPVAGTEYRIQSGDQLEIKFFYNPELNEQLIVRPDGRISLQLVNEIQAVGLTPAELADLLRKKFATEISKPEVTVIVRTFAAQKVFVDGEVNRAGTVPLTDPMTVLQAISLAGGKKDTALLDGVIVIRRAQDSKLVTFQLDLENAIDNTDMKQDMTLKPNDIVFVPKTTIANINVWVDQYIRRMLPVTPGLGFNLE